MEDTFFVAGYILLSLLTALLDVRLGFMAFNQRPNKEKSFSNTLMMCAVVDITYLASVLLRGYLHASIASSMYFVSVDWMLYSLFVFVLHYADGDKGAFWKPMRRLLKHYGWFEAVIFAINPFVEICMHYVPREAPVAHYSYSMLPLYYLHLAYTYFMAACVLFLLVRRTFQAPRRYRMPYAMAFLAITSIIFINGVFLFLPGDSIINNLDVSILLYSAAVLVIYWCAFTYTTHGMLSKMSLMIFNNVEQGIVLYDFEKNFIMNNKRVEMLLPTAFSNEPPTIRDLMVTCGVDESFSPKSDEYSVQCYIANDNAMRPLRCDFHRLRDKDGRVEGYLFVYTDAALETDLLTGFQLWKNFKKFAESNSEKFRGEFAAAVFDINGLGLINSSFGHDVGDHKISDLANAIRQEFPRDSYFVRGKEAYLIAVCPHCDEQALKEYADSVIRGFHDSTQYAMAQLGEKENISDAVLRAENALRTKKLLNKKSYRSHMLNTLVRALQESDSDTEAHVRRTQRMGAELGLRIGLSDAEQSQLSLLCLLHDIGKIGIPLEILNKPGKLNAQEWDVLRSHVEKGYQIAKSSRELEDIADMVRHHHERWDGKGYPDGLSRETIPLLSRIIAVVDAYDAMVNDRTYRQAMSVESALKELRSYAGTQFDPAIINEFIHMIEEKPEIGAPERIHTVIQPQVQSQPIQAQSAVLKQDKMSSTYPMHYSRYILDENDYIIEADDHFTKLTGYTLDEVKELHLRQMDLVPEADRTEYMVVIGDMLGKNDQAYVEHRLVHKDGSIAYVFCYGKRYYDSAAKAGRSEIIIADSADTYSMRMMVKEESERAEKRLRYWENTYRKDSLTGLLVHAAFQNDVEMHLLDKNCCVVLLMIDVDKFKEYNDTYGHSAGDEYLVLAAQALSGCLRRGDIACRMGGDEFAAALFFDRRNPSPPPMQERARQIFNKVNMTLRSTMNGTGISMGVAIADEEDETFKRLYKRADEALYKSKNNGRGQVTVYQE